MLNYNVPNYCLTFFTNHTTQIGLFLPSTKEVHVATPLYLIPWNLFLHIFFIIYRYHLDSMAAIFIIVLLV